MQMRKRRYSPSDIVCMKNGLYAKFTSSDFAGFAVLSPSPLTTAMPGIQIGSGSDTFGQ